MDKIKSYLKELPLDEPWFKYRLDKCLVCPNNTKNGAELTKWTHKAVEKTLANEQYGQCNLCGCPTERKCSVRSESCPDNPKQWDALDAVGKGSITDFFGVISEKGIKDIVTRGGTFVMTAEDVKDSLFLQFKVTTSFGGKFEKFTPGCPACTEGFVESIDDNNYTVKVKIKKQELGYHRVAFSITFNRNGMVGRAAYITMNVQTDFNKINNGE